MKEFLAIDIGASSGRHILGRVEDGKLILEEIYRFPNGPIERRGHLMWDVEHLFREIINGLKRAKELGRIPVSVGIDTWAVDYVLLNRNKIPCDVYSYRDSRTERVIGELHERIPFETLYEKTGIQFQPFNTIYQLFEDLSEGRLDGAKYMLMLPDYFHYRLTGKMSREYTNATSTGLINAKTHTWDKEIISRLGLPARLFPKTDKPGTVLGHFSKEIQKEVGFDAKVILPATHDTASAVVATTDENAPYLSNGTWSLLGIEQTFAHTDAVSRSYNYSNEGHLNGRFRLQKNIMGLWLIQQIRHEENDAYSFAELADMARKSPCKEVIDVSDSRFLAPKSMRAEVNAAAGRELPLGEMAYCVFHSLALGYAKSIQELESLTGEKYNVLSIIGGGTKNTLLNELTQEATGIEVRTGASEATAIGNLAVQMLAEGVFTDLKQAKKTVEQSI